MPSESLDTLRIYIGDVSPDAVVAKCEERSCFLDLQDISHRIVIKGEKVCRDKICDCIIFLEHSGTIVLCMVELKSKRVHASDIPDKFGNGARIALEILSNCGLRDPYILFFVLHKGIRSPEYRNLSSERVYLDGRHHPIGIKRCGSRLSELLRELQ